MLLIFASLLPAMGDTTINGRVVTVSRTSLVVDYATRDGRTLRAKLKLTGDTETVKDGKPAERSEVKPGVRVNVRVSLRGRVVLQIKLPDSPRADARPPADVEALVDGEINEIDVKAGTMAIRKPDGKTLAVKLDADVMVRLDGNASDMSVLKKGQSVRVGVLKRSRKVTRIFVYEVTTRPCD